MNLKYLAGVEKVPPGTYTAEVESVRGKAGWAIITLSNIEPTVQKGEFTEYDYQIINFIIAAMDYETALDAYLIARDKLDFWGPAQL